MFYIYRIINIINNKTYIGQRKCPIDKTPLQDSYMGSGKILGKAKRKYGIKNFKKEIIISNIETKEEIDKLEIFYIAEERKIGKSEYNICRGGGGFTGHHTEESKRKIGKASKGNKYALGYNIGNKHALGNILSDETKNKMGESRKGNSNNGCANIKCIETNEIHRTNEWIALGYRNAYQVAKGNRKHCNGLHFEYVV